MSQLAPLRANERELKAAEAELHRRLAELQRQLAPLQREREAVGGDEGEQDERRATHRLVWDDSG